MPNANPVYGRYEFNEASTPGLNGFWTNSALASAANTMKLKLDYNTPAYAVPTTQPAGVAGNCMPNTVRGLVCDNNGSSVGLWSSGYSAYDMYIYVDANQSSAVYEYPGVVTWSPDGSDFWTSLAINHANGNITVGSFSNAWGGYAPLRLESASVGKYATLNTWSRIILHIDPIGDSWVSYYTNWNDASPYFTAYSGAVEVGGWWSPGLVWINGGYKRDSLLMTANAGGWAQPLDRTAYPFAGTAPVAGKSSVGLLLQ
jgi:hypothetical protein